jgi:Protein of unknown function (DUF1592)/Protein of unknown function (DUF1588)/Protein of unknown function (DUF1585)/Protein of unknown function (DUF1595)/Protein of unknown function (DUF1587)/Ca-dependent carbohydrate-binding module xylan-binding
MTVSIALAFLAGCNGPDSGGQSGTTASSTTEPAEIKDPGTRPLQRLNATEYDTILAELLETDQTPGQFFPADEISYGFDNIAASLTTTSTHVELWEAASDSILDEVFNNEDEETLTYSVQAEGAGVSFSGTGELFDGDTAYALYDGSLSAAFSLEYDGDFDITVVAYGRPSALISPTMEIRVDGVAVGSVVVDATGGELTEYVFSAFVKDGLHTFEVAIANPTEDLKRALIVDKLQVQGPTNPETGQSSAFKKFVPCAPDGLPTRSCAEQSIPGFGLAAWRRPMTQEEVDWALGLYDAADEAYLDAGECLAYAFKGILMSPEFLYRIEPDPEEGKTFVALDGYQVATRLAAFVWSSTPDQALLDAAAAGALDTPEGVKAELVRMMADERASALIDNLAGQWFAVRRLESFSLDALFYPDFTPELRDSMVTELKLVLSDFFREGAPLEQVLTQQSTWVDSRLAELYLLPFKGGEGEWVEMSTVGTPRYGIFGTAGWLMAESRSTAPSAVKRGKWILENLLCSAPPPPPPDVEGQVAIIPEGGSVREQEEAQRADDYCQTCHSQMDPIGWSLHGLDADGSERLADELGFEIDDLALWNGVTFDGPKGMVDAIVADARLQQCVVEKTFTYALGRGVRIEDGPMIEAITAEFTNSGQSFEALATAIVTSDAFRLRGVPEVE